MYKILKFRRPESFDVPGVSARSLVLDDISYCKKLGDLGTYLGNKPARMYIIQGGGTSRA
jgi:hypothetical protein